MANLTCGMVIPPLSNLYPGFTAQSKCPRLAEEHAAVSAVAQIIQLAKGKLLHRDELVFVATPAARIAAGEQGVEQPQVNGELFVLGQCGSSSSSKYEPP